MGLPGFEPGSSGPKPERITKLPHSPLIFVRIEFVFKFIVIFNKIYKYKK